MKIKELVQVLQTAPNQDGDIFFIGKEEEGIFAVATFEIDEDGDLILS